MAFSTRKEAKEAGWFSRRHRTSEAHVASAASRNAWRGRWARRRAAEDRKAIWDSLTYAEKHVKAARQKERYDAARKVA